ncbi:cation efflux family protein [Clostridium paraputrificum]|uniref:cation diffusion facilitator family transporter n=1 Tax=Clostridium paraputrificum TaxID=29363 RepID=UPI0006BF9DDD|nr:cation transporter [Clostridium paraputrificum]CUQ43724.1 cation efflux family protein [Clostridium paraputrificum]
MKVEKNMLKFSALGCLFFAALGLGWGIVIKSSMIMFDGLYSFISLFLSILALWITNYISKNDFEKFPFGKGMLEPITVAFKSIVLIIMCSTTFINAVKEVMAGGNHVDTNMALWYSIISTVGCAIVYFVIDRKGKKLSSDLLNAESNQWLMDTILSAAVLVGFMVSFILSKTSLSYLTIYVDPFMVIISSVIFIRVPVVTLINSFKEIVNVNADDDINNKIYTIVKDIEEDYNFEDSITRVSKVGRELRIEIDFVFNEESTLNELEEMDKVRERVYKNMAGIKLDKWMNVNFTGDKKWAL